MSVLAAITGGAGFIGSHLAEGFLRNGYSVRALDNLSSGSLANLARIKTHIDYRTIDIRDREALREAFRDVSVVLHHAGVSSISQSPEDLTTTHEVNVTGTLNVLTAAHQAGVQKVVFASSASVYEGNRTDLPSEVEVPAPLSPYALSKWMGELYATQFSRSTSLETVSLRYFNVFGPRQNLESNYASEIPLLIRRLAEGSRPVIFGDGTQTRDFTYVDNIVEANLRAARASLPSGTILNIAAESRFSLNEVVDLLNGIFGSQKEPVYEPENFDGVKAPLANASLSRELLGNYSVADFRDGLVKTARWFLEISGRVQRCE
jgi:UDP-glucose 4-epimerase